MLKKFSLLEESGVTKKDFLVSFILLFNTLTWYYFTRTIPHALLLGSNPTDLQTVLVLGGYLSTIILSGIVGATLSEKIEKLHFIYVWIVLGVAASFLPLLLNGYSMTNFLIISISLGFSFGLGIPTCSAYFAECTVFENRGRTSGLVLLMAYLSAPLLLLLIGNNVVIISIVSFIWRALILGILFLLKPAEAKVQKKKPTPYLAILRNRSFLLYMIPWLMFCLVDRLERTYLEAIFEPWFFEFFNTLIAPLFGLIFAFVGGFMADRIGRKRVVIYGFITLGVEYALLGLAPTMVASWYVYSILDGIAWGMLTVTFFLILWGDLSPLNSAREKYYAIGAIPLFFTELVGILSRPYVQGIPPQSAYAVFSLASFFLFLAVLPLMYAPETLPEKKMEIRRLKGYIEQAKKFTEKYTKKSSNKS